MTEVKRNTNTKLERIAWLSSEDLGKEFTSLMHMYNVDSLRDCYHELDRKKAKGTDDVSKEEYGKDLSQNLENLVKRMKQMAYRPGPIREVLIPKEGEPGATRPLGICNFEDKIVQKMTQKILEAIYEPLFRKCSYGFRPGLGCHDAIKDLLGHLYGTEIEKVIDIDLGNFFGTINHDKLKSMMEMKIKDHIFMRYISRMFKAGVLSDGDLRMSEEGVVQGSCASPIMANIYAHYVIDNWILDVVQPRCKGRIRPFRYADDEVICCEKESDALRIMEVLGKRLKKFDLRLNEKKTKLVPFSKKKQEAGIIQGVFDFLGLTFYLGRSRKGIYIPKIKTAKKRLRSKLTKVNDWLRKNRSAMKLPILWNRFCSKLRGHNQYYGVSHNFKSISNFFHKSTRSFHKWLNRRSQKKSFCWKRFKRYMERNPPPTPKIVHRLF